MRFTSKLFMIGFCFFVGLQLCAFSIGHSIKQPNEPQSEEQPGIENGASESSVSEILLYLIYEDGKWGFIDATGKVVIDPQFDEAWDFSEGLATVRIGEKWGFIDVSGQYVVDPQFDETWYFSEGLAPVRVGEEWGYIDTMGQYVINPQFDDTYGFFYGLAAVRFGDLESGLRGSRMCQILGRLGLYRHDGPVCHQAAVLYAFGLPRGSRGCPDWG
jgi:hypothetical protein